MAFWLVPRLPPWPLIHVPDSAPLALSLLSILPRELLGYRLPRPHISRFRGYVFEFSTNGGDAKGSRRRYSDGYLGELLGEFGDRQVPVLYCVYLALAGPQHSPHLHDCRPARPVQQERPCCNGVFNWNRWAVQVHCHHAR